MKGGYSESIKDILLISFVLKFVLESWRPGYIDVILNLFTDGIGIITEILIGITFLLGIGGWSFLISWVIVYYVVE